MTIDKKISLGNLLTIFAIVGSFIYSASIMTIQTENAHNTAIEALNKANNNTIRIAVIETKIDEGFKNIEKLIKSLED